MRIEELDYDLPESAIATRPAEPRDAARLMVVERGGSGVRHGVVRDLPEHLRAGDVLVFNRTRVVAARFQGTRVGTGGRVEGLYLHDAERGEAGSEARMTSRGEGGGVRWVVMLKGGHLRAGAEVDVGAGVRLRVLGRSEREPEGWEVEVAGAGGRSSEAILEAMGRVPLPPYIRRARKHRGESEEEVADRARYQTVYAGCEPEAGGSVAAPTAGLHFTEGLLARLDAMGVERREVVLRVGMGTIRPVETATVQEHAMHAEWFEVPAATRGAIARARAEGRRVIAVGTTTVRALESVESMEGETGWRQTRLLIAPGWRFRFVDGLLTNFHLPRSTLMAMVGAFLEGGGGVARLRALYAEGVAQGYRFYSYGDAMLIV
ncbi:MAG: tRNA preQ1(34) S-adenosylmethionine ribosyltransferase-isomerase QueA [Phycisphaerae bacterium]|nr:tRNA preQ1(34) S-adenosylmethionine ribosyltransferase-isomerase QueA [Phycisphaerae bacterium]